MTFLPADLYHSGYLVEDIEESVARLAPVGISRWTAPKQQRLPLVRGDGTHGDCLFRYVYSVDGPHHIEFIQPIESDVLTTSGPMSFHHLGFWVDDLAGEVRRAREAGLRLDFAYLLPDESLKVSYHLDDAGMRYELVPSSHRAVLEERWADVRAGHA